MLTLGIDTATAVCSVALCHNGVVLAEHNSEAQTRHSRKLLPEIDSLLAEADIQKNDIEMVAVSIGPGSFTGLRIGLATAQAFAYVKKIYLHGVNTLTALAYNYPQDEVLLCPLIDAQKGNYYQALYQKNNGELQQITLMGIVNQQQLLNRIGNKQCILLGEHGKLTNLPPNIRKAPAKLSMPHAASICAIAERDFDETKDKRIFGTEPYYVRRSEAEELWERKHQ